MNRIFECSRMVLNRRVAIALVLTISIVWSWETSFAIVHDRYVGVSASGTKYEDYDPSGPILDDFNDNGLLNRWGGATGTFSDVNNYGYCHKINTPPTPYGGEGAFCLLLNYAVSIANSYSGYFSNLQSKNLSSYTTVSFWVNGKASGSFFKIELKTNNPDSNRNHAAVYVTDYLDGGVTTSSRLVTVPLHNFANISDWSSAKEFAITFENTQCSLNGSPLGGTIYIDYIAFGTTPVNVVRVDDFGDRLGTCALGGNIGNTQGNGGVVSYTFSSDPAAYYGYPYGLVSTYNVNASNAWAGHFMIFGGGDDGWMAIPHNFSEFNYLKIYIKARSDAENPKVLRIELVDNYGTRPVGAIGITSSWQYWRIPLTTFQNLDKSTIKQINFVFDSNLINYYAGSKTGDIYVDQVTFEKY